MRIFIALIIAKNYKQVKRPSTQHNNKRDWSTDIHNSMDKSQTQSERKKPDTRGPHNYIHMKFKNKQNWSMVTEVTHKGVCWHARINEIKITANI